MPANKQNKYIPASRKTKARVVGSHDNIAEFSLTNPRGLLNLLQLLLMRLCRIFEFEIQIRL